METMTWTSSAANWSANTAIFSPSRKKISCRLPVEDQMAKINENETVILYETAYGIRTGLMTYLVEREENLLYHTPDFRYRHSGIRQETPHRYSAVEIPVRKRQPEELFLQTGAGSGGFPDRASDPVPCGADHHAGHQAGGRREHFFQAKTLYEGLESVRNPEIQEHGHGRGKGRKSPPLHRRGRPDHEGGTGYPALSDR